MLSIITLVLFTGGGDWVDWPGANLKDFHQTLSATASTTELTVMGALLNGSEFKYGVPVAMQATATVYINGGSPTALAVDPNSFVVSGNSIPISAGDEITIRLEAQSTITNPDVQTVIRHQLSWTVPAGGGSKSWDNALSPMQVPGWDALYGWSGGAGDFTWTHTPVSEDGTTKDLTITTQLTGGGSKSSSVFDQALSAGTQTHTASFDKSDAVTAGAWEVYLNWENNTDDRETMIAIKLRDPSKVSATETFSQTKVGDVANWGP